jgi:hypothetical protein
MYEIIDRLLSAVLAASFLAITFFCLGVLELIAFGERRGISETYGGSVAILLCAIIIGFGGMVSAFYWIKKAFKRD